MKKAQSKHGFTLIELVLVASILAVLGMAVYGTFANGITIWKHVTEDSSKEDVNLFFEKISYDLRNSFKLTGMRFKGGNTKVSFPARMKYNGKDGLENTIGEITYYLDRRKKVLIRKEENYSDVYRKKTGSMRTLSENIDSFKLEYYIYDEKQKKYLWVTSWQEREEAFGEVIEETLPLIVKIKVGIPDEKGQKVYVKTVQLPAGCCWPVKDYE